MFDEQKSWQDPGLASELCVTLGVTSKETLIRMSSGKGGCEQLEECSPCDHVCSLTDCSREAQRHTRSSTKSDYLTPVSAFCWWVIPVTVTVKSSCQFDNTQQRNCLHPTSLCTCLWGISELLLDANAAGSSPLCVVPSLGLDCTRTPAEWARGSKPVSSIPPALYFSFCLELLPQGSPDDEPWPVSIINPFLSTLLLIVVYQAL